MSLEMSLFQHFIWLSSIPLRMCTASSLSIPLLVDVWVASMSWLQGTLGYTFLFKLQFPSDMCLGVGLLDRIVALCLVF